MAHHYGPALASVFGQQAEIGTFIQNYDFSRIDSRGSDEYLRAGLAPAFGKLNKEDYLKLDDDTKIMIAGTLKILSRQDDKSWDRVMAALMQNPLLEPDWDHVARVDKFTKSNANDFKFDGSPDAGIVREVHSWFTNLIGDQDVLSSTKIDLGTLAKIVARAGTTIDSFGSLFAKNQLREQTIVDVCVLRFPDSDHSFFKVYQIKLVAWSDLNRVAFNTGDSTGITGEFNSRTFKPRRSVIENLSRSAYQKAIEFADTMFDE